MRIIKRSAIALLLILLLLAVGVCWVLSTSTGLYFLLESAVRWVPELSIGQVSGGWGDLTLHDIRYRTSRVNLQIEQLHLAQSVGCLKRGQICIDDLWLQRVKIRAKNGAHATTMTIERVDTAASWHFNTLTLLPTHIEGVAVTMPTTSVARSDKLPAQSNTQGGTQFGEQLNALHANVIAHWSQLPRVISLPLAINVQSVIGTRWTLSGVQQGTIDRVKLSAHIRRSALSIDALSVQLAGTELNLHGNILLQKQYPLALTVVWQINKPPLIGEQLQSKLTGSLRGGLKLQLNLAGPLTLQSLAEFDVSQPGLPFTVSLKSDSLQWPLGVGAQLHAQDLSVRISGRLAAYSLFLKTRLSGSQIFPSEVTIQGSGDLQQLRIEQLQLPMLTGSATAIGWIAWHQQWRWHGDFSLQDLDISQLWPACPLKLAGMFEASGHLDSNNCWQVAIPITRLRGTLNDHPVDINGSLQRGADGIWTTPKIQASVGVNHFEVKGDLTASRRLQATINAPKLAELLHGLSGAMKGTLALCGTPKNPQLQAELQADNCRWQQLIIARVTMKALVGSGSQINGQISLGVEQLQQPGVKIDRLLLTARGNEQRHLLQVQVHGDPIAGAFNLHGRFVRRNTTWRGEFRETHLQTPVGAWRPTYPFGIHYQHHQRYFALSAHCWHNPSAVLYIPKLEGTGGDLEAIAEIQRLDLSMFKPFMSHLAQLKGVLTGHGTLRWQLGRNWPQLKLALRGQQIKVARVIHGQTPLSVDCETFTLNALLEGNRALLNGSLVLADKKGQVLASVQIKDPQHQRNLSGELQLNAFSLQLPLHGPLFPLMDQPPGSPKIANGLLNVNGRIHFKGTVAQPQLFGDIALTHGCLPGILSIENLVDGLLTLTFKGQRLVLAGQFKTTHGRLSLQGNAYWQAWRSWYSTVGIQGDPLRVNWSPDIQLQVVPDLQIEANPTQIKLNGQLTIPWARVNLGTLPASAVTVSKSEVILDSSLALAETKSTAFSIISDLSLCLGDEVQLKAFGLQGYVDGQAKVILSEQGLALHGPMNLKRGHLKAFGQNLLIRKGTLLFSGSVDQVMLNIEAMRDPAKTADNVLVGVRVISLADKKISMTVFSEPSLPHSDALSYLLSGQKQAAGNNNNALAKQISLILLQSGKVGKSQDVTNLVEQAAGRLGIHDLSLDTAVVGNGSQIVISGRLLRPDLQFRYGLGSSELILRFRIMPNMYIEMISGVERALDLLYQFEFS